MLLRNSLPNSVLASSHIWLMISIILSVQRAFCTVVAKCELVILFSLNAPCLVPLLPVKCYASCPYFRSRFMPHVLIFCIVICNEGANLRIISDRSVCNVCLCKLQPNNKLFSLNRGVQ